MEGALLHDKTKMSRDISKLKHSTAGSRGSNNIARKFSLSISWRCFNMRKLHSQGGNFLSAKMVMAGQGLLPKSSKLSHSLAFLQIVQAKASRSMPINFDWSSLVYMSTSELITVGRAVWESHGQAVDDGPESKQGEQSKAHPNYMTRESRKWAVTQRRSNQCWGRKINKCPLQKAVQQWL